MYNNTENIFPHFNMSEEAMKFFELGYKHQMDGKLDLAEIYYIKSLDIDDTAEGHTFLGWNYSFMGKIEEAIAECKIAIEIDPDFGNPYNDIGSYLLQQNKFDEALKWLKKAKKAVRYESPEFAYANTAQIHTLKGDWPLAILEYEELLKINPDYAPAIKELDKLKANLN